MDYVVGNVAALISGNVTPNRPKLTKRALTPIKHVPSPNVTPKSEFVDDRSVFLSPSVQKKKAIVKKSPKRIFQNPDMDVTNENEGNTNTSSPKADKVKKHLKDDLEAHVSPKNKSKAGETPENKHSKTGETPSPKKNVTNGDNISSATNIGSSNELTPKKRKKQRNSNSETSQNVINSTELSNPNDATPKKGKKKNKVVNPDNIQNDTIAITNVNANVEKTPNKKKKNKNKSQNVETLVSEKTEDNVNSENDETELSSPKKKNKKRKMSKTEETAEENEDIESEPTQNKKMKVNPNAITNKDTDSEHESDDEIESETEENNKEVLEKSVEAEEQSSDEETPQSEKKGKAETPETEKVKHVNTEEEIKRTLFVGNVPFSKKCKKEIKKIFNKYGQIESVRIRTVPVKDPSVTPKLAVIKQELHPERSTVNVYVKFADPQSVEDALAENNTILNNNHLRVSRSGSTGAEHDPHRSVFVGNIPFALEDEGLREKFQGCGEIESVRIVRDKNTNAGKGFGYVNFASRDGVELALALTDEDLTIKNRIMRVKRCTQATQRHARGGARGGPRGGANNRFQGRNKLSQGDRQRNNQGPSQGRNSTRGGFRGGRGGQSFRGSRGGGHLQGNRGGGGFGRQNEGDKQDGAYRRLKQKRQSQESGDAPPNKMARGDQPAREKKQRKEFVGMTAEKKKKHKFDKGQKKKKALSEILTK